MRKILLAAALSLAALLMPGLGARAQTPLKGPAAIPQPPPTTTPAPVPNVGPGVPGAASATVIPDQVAPPSAGNAGPSSSTPFSGNPAGQLPADTATPTSGAHTSP